MLIRARQQATANGTSLRLALPSSAVLRAIQVLGADTVLPIYPSLNQALAGPRVTAGARPAPGTPASSCLCPGAAKDAPGDRADPKSRRLTSPVAEKAARVPPSGAGANSPVSKVSEIAG
jgi:hypothetical protein